MIKMKISTLGIYFVMVQVWIPTVRADYESDMLAQKFREIKINLLAQEEHKRRVLSELFKVTLAMKKINKRRERLVNEKHFVQTKIQQTSSVLIKLKSKLDAQRELLRTRMRVLNKYNGQNAMRLIFSSQSPSDLDRNLKILKILADRDYNLIRSYEKNLEVYSRETKKLDLHQIRLGSIESELRIHEQELLAQQESKNVIVRGLDKNTVSQISRLEYLRAESVRSVAGREVTASELEQSFFEAKGKVQKPVKGEIVQRFGLIDDNRFGTKIRFKGVYIEAPEGSDVRSIFGGEVMFSDSIEGFGPTLVIGHGDRFYSVYGNNSSLKVVKGQKVQLGEVIALSGPGWQKFSAGTYFEIRHFSELMNPEDWLVPERRNFSVNFIGNEKGRDQL